MSEKIEDFSGNEAPLQDEVVSVTPEVAPNDGREEMVSFEEGQGLLEIGEQEIAIDLIASTIAGETGKTFTTEELRSDNPGVRKEIDGFFDRHPRAAKDLQILALSTTFFSAAGMPQEARADVVGDIVNTVAQGFLQQGNYASRQQVSAQQQQEQRYIQLQQQRMNVPSAKERIYDTYEQRRADLHHRNEMQRITDPNVRAEAELNYQEERALQNVDIQERQREQSWMNQDQIAAMRANAQIRHTGQNIQVNTVNRVIEQGTNDFLRHVLMGR